ncbi:unnamed protein product [Hyaloperonospora brassicae]|uniref:Ribonuclease P/MRP protein subunit POP5 n=1 Tax=Hyaloperonospora brassicae TaxID=162125 RepID=A0AAV0TMJ2_HYABA|nr:unnamed protein product [Hyaloperonospora brassicae]CAI5731670.1 unnamed protein product [Hyaloperonospora brassicae]
MVRLKTRYVVLEATTGGRKSVGTKEDIVRLVRASIAASYGDVGSGVAQYAFQVLYYNAHTRLAVVRCARELCKMVETSLVFVTAAHHQDVRLRVARVCGSSRTCRKYLLQYSMERAKTMNLYATQPTFDEDVQAEIARVDPH